ncbi:MAG TPA: hypothetical protein DD640_09660 [Clostridiales bacterium]|nr:hypothetical protein [Clostridiales bacterium]
MEHFIAAKPIWLPGKEQERNVFAGFTAVLDSPSGPAVLQLAGASFYKVYINGTFVHYGPAKAPHGYARIDRIDLSGRLRPGANHMAVEVAGYNNPAYNGLKMQPFLQAEVTVNGTAVLYTGADGHFTGAELTGHRQKVLRYSVARHYTEVYRLSPENGQTDWTLSDNPATGAGIAELALDLSYLERGAPYPEYDQLLPNRRLKTVPALKRSLVDGVPALSDLAWVYYLEKMDTERGLLFDSLEARNVEVFEKYDFPVDLSDPAALEPAGYPFPVRAGEFSTFIMPRIEVGFIQTQVTALEDSVIYLIFDEKILGNRLSSENHCLNAVSYHLKKSAAPYDLTTFEPYGLMYAAVVADSGSILVHSFGVTELAHPQQPRFQFHASSPELNEIMAAAVHTFRHNALDIFMDCASRERAGWLCDSCFTARGEPLWGDSCNIGRNSMNNYRLYTPHDDIPAGMLPMNYPGDHVDHCFIPQWAMWFVIQLDEYLRNDPRNEAAAYRKICYDLLAFLGKYLNQDGLLEKLPGWNFVEWSQANQWVLDVSYPTNMLYSRILTLIGSLFQDDDLLQQARQVKNEIIRQAFDGTCFVDNAIRDDQGQLKLTGNRSEVCQYYACYFDIADLGQPEFAGLRGLIFETFGPDREKLGIRPDIAYANAFMGNYLRMELLQRLGYHRRMLNEIVAYFLPMARTTGTLWEMMKPDCSLDHGFASFIGVLIARSLSGILDVDERRKIITIHDAEIPYDADISLPLLAGDAKCSRRVVNGRSVLELDLPEGYQAILQGGSGETMIMKSQQNCETP